MTQERQKISYYVYIEEHICEKRKNFDVFKDFKQEIGKVNS